MKTEKLLKMYAKEIPNHFSKENSDFIIKRLYELHQEYSAAHQNDIPKLKQHNDVIFVGVAIYQAIQELNYTKEEALKLTDDIFQSVALTIAVLIRKILKVPGLYKHVPKIVSKLVPKKYSESSGFEFKFYDVGKQRVKFDMTACPYHDICKDMGCEELTVVYCHNDDCCYGNMHPKLKWNRTKTIGEGAKSCDFDIEIKED